MDVPITLWLSEDDAAALAAQARRYQQTSEARVWAWIQPSLDQAVKEWQDGRWVARKKAIEIDPVLAETVDAKVAP